MKDLESMWDIESFPILEQRSMWEVILPLVKGEDLQR